MADAVQHGNHDHTFQFDRRQPIDESVHPRRRQPIDKNIRPTAEAKTGAGSDGSVIDDEWTAIKARREHVGNLPDGRKRDRLASPLTGLANSGGGIRSASFGLGCLQGLEVTVGIDGIDYLSTVSGGGYTGCALTCAMQHTGGQFPFLDAQTHADTASVRHIRDFSNYLIPHGGTDIVTAFGIILRGIVANALIILPIILFFSWLMVASHPDGTSLTEPTLLLWNLKSFFAAHSLLRPMLNMPGFWFTAILLCINLLFLAVWVFAKSLLASRVLQSNPGNDPELGGVFVTVSKILFFLIVIAIFYELQPLILHCAAVTQQEIVNAGASSTSASLQGWILKLTPLLTSLGAIIALFSKYLGDVVAVAKRSTTWTAWLKKLLAKAIVWLGAIILPCCLWLLYLALSYFGIFQDGWIADRAAAAAFIPWGGTVSARLLLELVIGSMLLGFFVNPNATSLHRMYRDRLSKAFLFDPAKRDSHDDLEPACPKLHQIDTRLCPYPVINAALNIEGSRYVNRRGRNADFFIFTPEYTGSDATGYVGTKKMEDEESTLDLGTAMAISGAAISSNMGSQTIRPLSLTFAILNVRLGVWLSNPRWIIGKRSRIKRFLDFRNLRLFQEMFNLITERSGKVYLTDGGNIENLGVYSLLKRKCPVIIAVDAEADPALGFDSFLVLERYARIDLGVTIDLPWQAIRNQTLAIDKAFDDAGDGTAKLPSEPGPHCAAGEIQYGAEKKGILFYVKASLTGDESDYVLDYKRRNLGFPHETTGDQFFGEEQLEAYRALGFHIMRSALAGEVPFAVKPNKGESEEQARQRILKLVTDAIRGTVEGADPATDPHKAKPPV